MVVLGGWVEESREERDDGDEGSIKDKVRSDPEDRHG